MTGPGLWRHPAAAGSAPAAARPTTTRRQVRAAAITAVVAAASVAALAAAGAAGGTGGSRGAGAPRTVELVVRHSRFEPAHVTVAPGAVVRFVVRNDDPIDHELIVGDDATHRRHESGSESLHTGVPGEVSVPAGTTAATTWRAPERPGPVSFACHLPGHVAYGMVGTVVSAGGGTGAGSTA